MLFKELKATEYSFFKYSYIQFCRMSIVSLKRGNYSGSNGGIFVDFFFRPEMASTRRNSGS